MDPLTIATSVISFVDFGFKLVSLYQQIQRSEDGRPAKLADLEKGLQELSQNASDARAMIADLNSRYPQHSESLDRLSNECDLAQRELQNLTQGFTTYAGGGLKGHGVRMVGAVRSFRKEKDMDNIEGRMRKIREQTVLVLSLCTLDSVQHNRQSSGGMSHDILQSIRGLQSAVDNLKHDFHGQYPDQPSPKMLSSNRLKDGLWTSISVALQEHNHSLANQASSFAQNNDAAVDSKIIESLEFDDMRARSSQISEPFPNTFQWLLDDPSPTDEGPSEPRAEPTGFKEWLQSPTNESPFWITGIPASGKSTLMKFICTQPEVPDHLRLWSKGHQLLICNIYFWNAGSSLQKTQSGLLLTMLHQLLSQQQHLCRMASPERYMYYQIAGPALPQPPDWTVQELQSAILRLLPKVNENHRLAIFVDGLDEYEGDMKALVAFVKQLHRQHNIKLCISSRPWNLFRDEFATYPSLRMEHFNRADIKAYVHSRMASSRAIEELRQIDHFGIQKLESQIMEKASGVFLWVVLVVESLLTTAENNNDLAVIWKLYDALPPGLEELYDSIRRRLNKSELEGASKMYQLLFQWGTVVPKHFSAGDFWTAVNCDSSAEIPPWAGLCQALDFLPVLKRRVTGCTRGMLQIISVPHSDGPVDYHVDFLHRTVFDWLQQRKTEIVSDGPSNYDSNLILASVLAFTPELHVADLTGNCAFYNFYRSIGNKTENKHRLIRMFEELPFCYSDRERMDALYNFEGDYLSAWKRLTSQPRTKRLLALVYACVPYIEAKLESGSDMTGFEPGRGKVSQKLPRIMWSSGKKRELERICRAMLDIDLLDIDLMYDKNQDMLRDFANAKLKTVEIIFKSQSLPVRDLKDFVGKKIKENSWPEEYWQSLSDGIRGKGFVELINIKPKPPILIEEPDYGNLSDPDD